MRQINRRNSKFDNRYIWERHRKTEEPKWLKLSLSVLSSAKETDDIWKQWFGILKKRIHMEMEEPMFSIQMFTGSHRDSGTQMISRLRDL